MTVVGRPDHCASSVALLHFLPHPALNHPLDHLSDQCVSILPYFWHFFTPKACLRILSHAVLGPSLQSCQSHPFRDFVHLPSSLKVPPLLERLAFISISLLPEGVEK
jgi:hypothetical protein